MKINLLRSLGRIIFSIQYARFVASCKAPEAAQALAWRRIQLRLSHGSYWRSRCRNFSRLELSDFPISDYEDYRDSLSENFSVANSVFTGEPIEFWSESSGTTGKAKVYPITKSYRSEFQMVNGPFLFQVIRGNPSFLKNKTLYFAATHPTKKTKAGVGVGFISAYNYVNIPALFKTKYAFPNEVFRDRDTFFRWGALYALAERVDTFVAITPSIVERFFLEVSLNRDFYLSGLDEPKVPSGFPPLEFSEPERARLRSVLTRESFGLQDLWPDLRTLICWKSSTCGLQLQSLKPVLGSIRVVDALYAATEGWMNVPFGNDETGGPLHCGGHVYEFIEVGKEISNKNLIRPWELKEGFRYEIFLTTSMGFIRFRLRDIVLCRGHFHRSPIIEFLEKEGQSISIGHTRVSDVHLLRAVEILSAQLPQSWFVTCSVTAKQLVLAVPPGSESRIDGATFDQALRQANLEYDDDRSEGLLEAIAVVPLELSDPLWPKAEHAQAKPKLIVQGAIDPKR